MIAQSIFQARGLAVPASDFAPDAPPAKPVLDPEYEAWKREHGLDIPLTAQQIEDVIRYELAVL